MTEGSVDTTATVAVDIHKTDGVRLDAKDTTADESEAHADKDVTPNKDESEKTIETEKDEAKSTETEAIIQNSSNDLENADEKQSPKVAGVGSTNSSAAEENNHKEEGSDEKVLQQEKLDKSADGEQMGKDCTSEREAQEEEKEKEEKKKETEKIASTEKTEPNLTDEKFDLEEKIINETEGSVAAVNDKSNTAAVDESYTNHNNPKANDMDDNKSNIDDNKSDIDDNKSDIDDSKSDIDDNKAGIEGNKANINGDKPDANNEKSDSNEGDRSTIEEKTDNNNNDLEADTAKINDEFSGTEIENDKKENINFNADIDDFLNETDEKPSLEDELTQFTSDLQKPSRLTTDSDDKTPRKSLVNLDALEFETDFLARRIQEGRDQQEYLNSKVHDKDRELEIAETKIKDLKLRLIRFTKDDQAKDKHIASLENELKEINKKLEDLLDEYQHSKPTSMTNANKIEAQREDARDNRKQKSKICVIL